jgi:homocysteine S-methyltransferase
LTQREARERALGRLGRGEVLLFDGGMGTEIYGRGVFINTCYDELNVTRPELVRAIHDEYVAAGADLIETNTFGANQVKLKRHGLAGRVAELNQRGAELAREAVRASRRQVLVMGAVGPLGVRIEPFGPTSLEEARGFFRGQVEALVAGGADGLILETFFDVEELHQAVLAAREVAPDALLVAQMTVDEDGNTLYGARPEDFGPALAEWGVDVAGVNCSVGPAVMLEVLKRLRPVTRIPLSVHPNAGVPRNVEGRNLYLCSPEYLAEYAGRFIRVGANVIGGCCGTTPAHIRAMRNTIRSLKASRVSPPRPRPVEGVAEVAAPVLPPGGSRLGRALADGRFVVSVELTPPRGVGLDRMLARALEMHTAGVQFVNIPDGPRATARMSALAAGVRIQAASDVEVVLHYTCRDRNLLGIQSDLLGAWALGVRNLLLVTGDPPKMGTYPDATAVFDVDSIGLCQLVRHLNSGRDLGGTSLGTPTGFVYGVGLNPGAINLEEELHRFFWKVDAGAQFAITQPVFDAEVLARFLERLEREGLRRIPILAGIWPLTSLAGAEFLNNEVPGASVPTSVLQRMARAEESGPEAALQEGVALAREILERVRPMVAGAQLSAPGGRVDQLRKVLEVGSPVG